MKNTLLTLSFSVVSLGVVFAQNTIPTVGNVGIGTTAPNSQLDVKGRVNIDSTLIVKDSVTLKKNLRVEENVRFLGLTKLNDTKVLTDFTVNGLSKLKGNVKMTALESIANLNNKYVVLTNENGMVKRVPFDTLIGVLKSGIYAPPPFPPSPEPIDFCNFGGYATNPYWMAGTNKLYVSCPDVKVGIGTDAPTHGLHVTSDARFGQAKVDYNQGIGAEPSSFSKLYIKNSNQDASIEVNHTDNNKPYQKFLDFKYTEPTTEILKAYNSQTGSISYLFEASGKMTVSNGTGNIFQLDPSGKLTIGNGTEKTLQLEPDGMLRGRRIKLDVDSWADFVFDENYPLMPLSEIEQFVKEENHLPNVPSEEELINNGMDVQEMNKLLMQKVEELTLYLIEQNKELESLKLRLNSLELSK